jgi:uncharacterized protein (TIGR02448 family)
MKWMSIYTAFFCIGFSDYAGATSIAATLDAIGRSIEGSSQATSDVSSSGSSSNDNKVVSAARDDAAAFVATNGAIRAARLEQALLSLRELAANQRATDLQLAQAILANN